MIYTTKIPSPAGKITLASDGIHLIGLWFDGQQYFAHTIKEETKENPGLFIFTQTRDWLDRYFPADNPRSVNCPCARTEVYFAGRCGNFCVKSPTARLRLTALLHAK